LCWKRFIFHATTALNSNFDISVSLRSHVDITSKSLIRPIIVVVINNSNAVVTVGGQKIEIEVMISNLRVRLQTLRAMSDKTVPEN